MFLIEKKLFLSTKKNFSKSKNLSFPKGLTHAFGQKMPILSLFGFGINKTKNKV